MQHTKAHLCLPIRVCFLFWGGVFYFILTREAAWFFKLAAKGFLSTKVVDFWAAFPKTKLLKLTNPTFKTGLFGNVKFLAN